MADDADRAQAQIDQDLAQALTRRAPVIQATGQCLYCEEPLPPGQKFCDLSCSEDHDRVIQAQTRNGKGT